MPQTLPLRPRGGVKIPFPIATSLIFHGKKRLNYRGGTKRSQAKTGPIDGGRMAVIQAQRPGVHSREVGPIAMSVRPNVGTMVSGDRPPT